ncbi:MAG: NADH-quinone oxidoreductase subunit M [Thermodesulfovibrionales bacterium]
MTLAWLILLPLIGGIVSWYAGRVSSALPRWIALIVLALMMALVVGLWTQPPGATGILNSTDAGGGSGPGGSAAWLDEMKREWVPALGIRLHLAMDGLSLLLVLLTVFLGIASVLASWTEIRERVGFFHLNLLWILAGINGVFLAMDLFLFYFFWELMLVPMYFLISLWGHENRHYAAFKFFLFTQVSGLLMLIAILGLYFEHARITGVYTFGYQDLLGTPLERSVALWLLLGFFAAFAVKMPVVLVHTWLPDAHTEAPTAGSVILAGLMLKTGGYGLLRFAVPLFPQAALDLAPAALALAVGGILYGAVVAFAQTDLKRLVAYTSVSHMGFVLLGIFSWNTLALQGAVMEMLCHGVATGALFIIVGALQERIHTRDMARMGGLWETVPRMGAISLFFALASLGLPGLGNFVGEILVLFGAFRVSLSATVLAAAGLVTAAIYSLWIIQRVYHGENTHYWRLPDFGGRELAMMGAMIAVLLWLGLYPQPVLTAARMPLLTLQREAAGAATGASERKRAFSISPAGFREEVCGGGKISEACRRKP